MRAGLKNRRFAAGTRVVCPGQTLDNAWWREEKAERERERSGGGKERKNDVKANTEESHVFQRWIAKLAGGFSTTPTCVDEEGVTRILPRPRKIFFFRERDGSQI